MIEKIGKILKIRSKRPPHKAIIISSPAYVHEYMTLFCLAKRITKSKIIKTFVDDWVKEHRLKDTDETLIIEIADGYSEQYLDDVRFKGISIEEYKIAIRQELANKGVKALYIDAILSKIKAV